jgi:hypothetical protein
MPSKSFLSSIHGPQDLGATMMAEYNLATFDHGKMTMCWGKEILLLRSATSELGVQLYYEPQRIQSLEQRSTYSIKSPVL